MHTATQRMHDSSPEMICGSLPDYRMSRTWREAYWPIDPAVRHVRHALCCMAADKGASVPPTGYSWREYVELQQVHCSTTYAVHSSPYVRHIVAGPRTLGMAALPRCDVLFGIEHDGDAGDVWLEVTENPFRSADVASFVNNRERHTISAVASFSTPLPVVALYHCGIQLCCTDALWQRSPVVRCTLGVLPSSERASERDTIARGRHHWDRHTIHNGVMRAVTGSSELH